MTSTPADALEPGSTSIPRTLGRWGLATVLLLGGIGHLARPEEFLAQVPPFFPAREKVVYYSTFVEFALALALVLAGRHKVRAGWVVAAFFVAIFPGNVSQLLTRTDAFGLDSDLARGIRLLFQPLLVILALWSTGAWRAWRNRPR